VVAALVRWWPVTTDMLSPPEGWPRGFSSDTVVMTNYDHSVDEAVAERLRRGGECGQHTAFDFHAWVWFADGRWHEQVFVHHVPQGSFCADTLQELMKIVNDEFGWR
jgi:hypothetical protein